MWHRFIVLIFSDVPPLPTRLHKCGRAIGCDQAPPPLASPHLACGWRSTGSGKRAVTVGEHGCLVPHSAFVTINDSSSRKAHVSTVR